jgi:hypothetical protein
MREAFGNAIPSRLVSQSGDTSAVMRCGLRRFIAS